MILTEILKNANFHVFMQIQSLTDSSQILGKFGLHGCWFFRLQNTVLTDLQPSSKLLFASVKSHLETYRLNLAPDFVNWKRNSEKCRFERICSMNWIFWLALLRGNCKEMVYRLRLSGRESVERGGIAEALISTKRMACDFMESLHTSNMSSKCQNIEFGQKIRPLNLSLRVRYDLTLKIFRDFAIFILNYTKIAGTWHYHSLCIRKMKVSTFERTSNQVHI